MNATTKYETKIEADPSLPTVTITRDFDATPDKVFRAWIEPELVSRWLGPKDLEMRIDTWDGRTGGAYRYRAVRDGEQIASFYGSFHEVRPSSRLVQTFTFDGAPDGVSLETVTFEDLGDGRTRVVALSVVESLEIRDMILASGMDTGVVEGYEQLDQLLAGD
ncbi:SRPBCC family protein [Prauserella cavernicola]|uniref:SRPBCC family protein n=1 Tax=Prauserella cavernicola TaxID=2800127 RepID=A0A934V9E1_9PSEU|nr:SRPBCC family protein [Prauserella cavernicola]MBK1789250.1 SRPBCC family protein [Prauserella cavernicola]